jgi:hypothetical protein
MTKPPQLSDQRLQELQFRAEALGTGSIVLETAELDLMIDEILRLRGLINSPQTGDFLESVRFEAAHQVLRWGAAHDARKTDAAWFWLIGYLGGKALHNPPKDGAGPLELKLHRIVTIAAAACNWFAAVKGPKP